ncbi:hypothetical protein [Alteribacter natronophilus]|uniref:hypothetical protein n=1 Tax=Alteribacter natronophilus TaxID=2583810 RepID=UPI00110D3E94|nr:hypothetical protein [Alteribacter natronophilus]TMW71160.1 hypothetical protein FGB90_14450 [Alteribacter natronophilus]
MEVIEEKSEGFLSQDDKDGGYYAIKGFLYQFDKTIIEILENPDKTVSFENVQDIDYKNTVIQVKHKEAQNYSPSKIRRPIKQLIKLFEQDKTKTYYLYCFFKDKSPQTSIISIDQLNEILGKDTEEFNRELLEKFIDSFALEFTEDYEETFRYTLDLIGKAYGIADRNLAIIQHSIIRSEIFRLVIKEKKHRALSKKELDNIIENHEQVIFYAVYKNSMDSHSYEQFMKKQFFTIKGLNLHNFERLFIIDASKYSSRTELAELTYKIRNKYYRKDKSPSPIICFRNIRDSVITELKKSMADKNEQFFDGTYFDDDKFRMRDFIERNQQVPVRFIKEDFLPELTDSFPLDKVYQFFSQNRLDFSSNASKDISVEIDDIKQAINIIS